MTRTVTAHTIAASLRRVKALPQLVDAEHVLTACRAAGHVWRDGTLNPLATITLFLIQVLHGNTACEHLRHLSPLVFTASAYCQARRRLPLTLFRHLLRAVTDAMFDATESIAHWRGHRTFLLDGSSFSMPDTPELMERFGHPPGQKPGCAFPCAHLMMLCDLATGLIREVVAAPLYTHDLTAGVKLHPVLRAGDLLIADRGFAGWALFALYMQHQVHLVIRMHQRLLMSFDASTTHHPTGAWARLYRLGANEQVIEWFKPKTCPRSMARETYEALPPSIIMRVIRYSLKRRGFRTKQVTLMTTLIDHERYPAEEIAALYGQRWEIETHLRSLKQTMGMDTLRCKTADGVEKELMMYALAYNLVRMEMVKAGYVQRVDPRRISFVDALRSLRARADRAPARNAAGAPRRLVVNPDRSGRVEPHAVKRRPKQHRRLTLPRTEERKRLLRQRLAA